MMSGYAFDLNSNLCFYWLIDVLISIINYIQGEMIFNLNVLE